MITTEEFELTKRLIRLIADSHQLVTELEEKLKQQDEIKTRLVELKRALSETDKLIEHKLRRH